MLSIFPGQLAQYSGRVCEQSNECLLDGGSLSGTKTYEFYCIISNRLGIQNLLEKKYKNQLLYDTINIPIRYFRILIDYKIL